MGKTALILGSTGLTGGWLLKLLLNDARYSEIRLFNRNSIEISHPKITEYIVDLMDLESHKDTFEADEVFCCIGTTKTKTPDKELYTKIDYGIPVTASKLCKANKIKTFVVMSSLGANPKSSVFYNRTKGKMEDDVLKQDIENTYIVQPSLIGGEREEKRIGESIGKILMKVIRPFLFGPLKKYRIIHPQTIAKAIISLANATPASGIYKSDVLKTWSNSWQ
ncbi:NAD(P)H-binding protein [Winogradskyella sp. A3E31]|uniref:NAD(P)H-binding protein n=1 Tax=Winogradskyella sp. A3E31 TaxID=3349637 RepID=UPI00398ACF00